MLRVHEDLLELFQKALSDVADNVYLSKFVG